MTNPRRAEMNVEKRTRTLEKMRRKYPDVDINVGFIPMWVIRAEAHPVLTKALMSFIGAGLGALLMLLILPR